MIEFKYDTQLLIEGQDLSEDSIKNHINYNFEGDCLLVVGDSDLIKLHFHTNKPWEIIEYCSSLGEIFDIVIEDMSRQEKGLRG
jgi:dihydroxyacetone kinase-like predicted kinase